MTATMNYPHTTRQMTGLSKGLAHASTLGAPSPRLDGLVRASYVDEARKRAILSHREAEADAAIAEGRTAIFESAEDLFADLDDDL